MSTFAERVTEFNEKLELDQELPAGIEVMNPFSGKPQAVEASSAFYRKFYSDNRKRILILGINPGRFGGGVTGIPFTDTKRLREKCGIEIEWTETHEPSSVFVYEVIEAYGGVERFYSDFYINSPSPLGFVKKTARGGEKNFNYYDSPELLDALYPFLIRSIRYHISVGTRTDRACCMGTGKNYKIISKLNKEHGFFERLIPLEHPRYIIQYKSRSLKSYIKKYLDALSECVQK